MDSMDILDKIDMYDKETQTEGPYDNQLEMIQMGCIGDDGNTSGSNILSL